MTHLTRHNPDGFEFPGMSQAVRAHGWILVSGQVALDVNGQLVGENDPQAQAEQVFDNIAAALKAAGSSLNDVIKLTCYLTSRDAYPGYSSVKNQRFGQNPPASTVVVVKELLLPGLFMEVEAIAWIGEQKLP